MDIVKVINILRISLNDSIEMMEADLRDIIKINDDGCFDKNIENIKSILKDKQYVLNLLNLLPRK